MAWPKLRQGSIPGSTKENKTWPKRRHLKKSHISNILKWCDRDQSGQKIRQRNRIYWKGIIQPIMAWSKLRQGIILRIKKRNRTWPKQRHSKKPHMPNIMTWRAQDQPGPKIRQLNKEDLKRIMQPIMAWSKLRQGIIQKIQKTRPGRNRGN